MLAKEMSDLRDYMHNKGIMFCFSGYMTEEILSGIGQALKKKLEIEETDRRTVKGMFSVFVELVQNVIRYSAEKEFLAETPELYDLRYGVLTVGHAEDAPYYVACGNLIANKDVPRLEEGLNHIASLDKDGLRALYKETLKGDTPEGSKGAGVGFIEIARRADNGFEFDFQEVDGDHSFFSLKAFL